MGLFVTEKERRRAPLTGIITPNGTLLYFYPPTPQQVYYLFITYSFIPGESFGINRLAVLFFFPTAFVLLRDAHARWRFQSRSMHLPAGPV